LMRWITPSASPGGRAGLEQRGLDIDHQQGSVHRLRAG
jgi:hypothetical protein